MRRTRNKVFDMILNLNMKGDNDFEGGAKGGGEEDSDEGYGGGGGGGGYSDTNSI